MGMKLKSGADLCGFQLTNFCVQGEASAPSDAALGRKYFHTNATDDVATGISLLNRERIYLGEGAWRATAYLDDIAGIQTKLDMILGDVDLDGVIENMNEVIKFLENNKDTENLMTLLDDKLSKSKGGIMTGELCIQSDSTDASAYIAFKRGTDAKAYLLYSGGDDFNFYSEGWGKKYTFIHSGNIGSQKVAGLVTPRTIWGQSFDGTGDIANNTAGTMRRLLFHDTFNDSGTTGYIGKASSSNNDVYVNSTYNLRLMSGDNYTMWLNASGNVTIGGSDLAGTSAKLYVDGGVEIVGGIIGKNASKENESFIGSASSGVNGDGAVMYAYGSRNLYFYTNKNERMRVSANGNVLIGITTDSGYKLDVNGTFNCNAFETSSNGECFWGGSTANYGRLTWGSNGYAAIFATGSNELRLGVGSSPIIRLFPSGDVRITGNLIVDGEVSAGGAGAEEGTSGSGGSVDFHSEDFTPSTSTTYQVNHNLGKKVIVQVYEQGATSETWNLVMVDVEIISATRLDLRFGKIEDTPHRVVVMGAGV